VGAGLAYLNDFTDPYLIWCRCCESASCSPGCSADPDRPAHRRAAGAPVLTGLLLGVYVVKVGGDYMHAGCGSRSCSPCCCRCCCCRSARPPRGIRWCGAAAVWALVAGSALRPPYQGEGFAPGGLVDGAAATKPTAYQDPTRPRRCRAQGHQPVDAAAHPDRQRHQPHDRDEAAAWPANGGTVDDQHVRHGSGPHAFFYDNMGITDAVMPLNGTVSTSTASRPRWRPPAAGTTQPPGPREVLPAAWSCRVRRPGRGRHDEGHPGR